SILVSRSEKSEDIGFYAEFWMREQYAADLAAYYKDPAFADELAFFRAHKTRGESGRAYRVYHATTASPLIRTLAGLLWRLNQDVHKRSPADLEVLVDRFSGADGVDHVEVLHA